MYYFYYQAKEYEPAKFKSILIIGETSSDNFFKFQFLVSIIIAIQWLRIFFVFLASRSFGPLIKILTSMLKDVSKFLIIFGLIFMIFTSAGRIMFINLEDFSTVERTIVYLYSACLGNFEFSIFDAPMPLDNYYGYVYLILFLLITSIVFLNFIIAILTNVYMIWQQYDEGLYLRQIIMIRQLNGRSDIDG